MQATFRVNETSNNTSRFSCPIEGCSQRCTSKNDLRLHLASRAHNLIMQQYQPTEANNSNSNSNNNDDNSTATGTTSERQQPAFVFAENMFDDDESSSVVSKDDAEVVPDSFQGTDETVVDEEPVEASNPLENGFSSSAYRSVTFPFNDKIHKELYAFYYRNGGDITQTLMKEIINLCKKVVAHKVEYKDALVPAADLIFNFDDPRRRNYFPTMKLTEKEVVVRSQENNEIVERRQTFYMNTPTEILKLLVGNPTTVNRISRLPDFTENQMIESYQGLKWKTNESFQHPMVTVTVDGMEFDYWVGDLVLLKIQKQCVLSRFFTINHSSIMVEAYEVESESDRLYLLANRRPLVINVTEDILLVISNKPETLDLRFKPDVYDNALVFNDCNKTRSRLTKVNPLKKPLEQPDTGSTRQFMRVMVVPINLFTDDMSGNRTKKYNKVDNWSLVPAALPLYERNQMDNTYYICADNKLSAMQMLPGVVEEITKLDHNHGVVMIIPSKERVLVTAPVQFITADNARHAELASSKGSRSLQPCRKCIWRRKTPGTLEGGDYYNCTCRSEQMVEQIFELYTNDGTGNVSLLTNTNGCYKLVGGQELLKLKSFATMLDTPVELLHCIMLGVGKDLFAHLHEILTEPERKHLEGYLRGYDSKGFSRKLQASTRLRRSYLGRDYKIVLQQTPIALDNLIRAGRISLNHDLIIAIKNCFDSLGKFISLVYTSNIDSNFDFYVWSVHQTYEEFRKHVLTYEDVMKTMKNPPKKVPAIYNSSKMMHILSHLPGDIIRFGSPIFYESEKGEQFNKFIREASFRTNRHNLSKDIARGFANRAIAKHIFTGGIWVNKYTKNIESASPTVINEGTTLMTRNFDDNNRTTQKFKLGSTGLFEANGKIFLGEISKFDPLNSKFTFNIFCPLLQPPQHQNPFYEYSLRKITDENCLDISIEQICQKDQCENIVCQKILNNLALSTNDVKLLHVLDISQRLNSFYLLNVSKFGAFWLTKTYCVA